jgi:hypothetical protein
VLSDLLYPPQRVDAATAVFQGAEAVARLFHADGLLCSASHRAVTSMLPRLGYIRVPANLHFMIGRKTELQGFPMELPSWWITRGDANSDEVF